MTCEEFELQLDGFLDGTLDPAALQQVEIHLRDCAACRDRSEQLRRVLEVVGADLRRRSAPPQLRTAVAHAVRATDVAARPRRWPVITALAAGLLLGVAGGWQLALRRSAATSATTLADAVVSAHIRALQPDHLADVTSTDHHTVKPWFAGKLDFSPPVPELGADGYPLVGGRLDVLQGHTVAALVYAHGNHLIDVFLWPAQSGASAPATEARRGFQLMHGSSGAMNYWIVSDLNAAELGQFAGLVAQATATSNK